MVDISGIDIILACWLIDQDTWDMTKSSISSLKELGDNRLIVVDNASPMGGGYLREVADIYIRNQTNLGYAPANNQALKLVQSEYVCFAQNDTFPYKNALSVSKEILDEHKDVATVHIKMGINGEDLVLGEDVWVTGKERWCSFSFFVARRSAIDFLDENYIMANYEDYDFLQNVRTKGFKTAYTNKTGYIHNDSYTQRKLDQEERQKWADINKEYFKSKWGDYPDECFQKQFSEQWEVPWRPFP